MKITTTLIAGLFVSLTSFALAEGGKCEEKKAAMLEKYDIDNDGKLSEEERQAAKEDFKAAMLEKYDTDGDGELSPEEKKAAFIAKFDKDGDGELSEEEKKAAKKGRGKHGKCEKGGKGKGKGKGPRGGGEGGEA